MFARHCSIIVDAKELFGAESKSQVYALVHNLLKKIKDTGTRIFVMNNLYDYKVQQRNNQQSS